MLLSVSVDELQKPHAQAHLLRAMQLHGAVVLTFPPEAKLAEKVAACYSTAACWFRQAESRKSPYAGSDTVGRQHGWLCPSANKSNGTQFFEVKKHFDESAWSWPTEPSGFATAAIEAYELLRSASTSALTALVEALGMDAKHVLSHLDSSHPSPPPLADASHSALRIWSYQAGTTAGAWHCDNSFVTVGARGTCRGLHVRLLDGELSQLIAHPCELQLIANPCLLTLHLRPALADHCTRIAARCAAGRYIYPEDFLSDDQIILYSGDTLSYLSGGRISALMHEVDSPPAGQPPRLSIPFFLRARRDGVLRPALASRGLPAAAALPPLSVEDLEENEGGVRQSWEWKRESYFTAPSALTGLPPAQYGMKYEEQRERERGGV